MECVYIKCRSTQDLVGGLALRSYCQQLGCKRISGVSIQRHRLGTDNPETAIHIGKIASANTVMRSGEHRDELVKNENMIGFEMEGAGVWDILPCLIIKGVCDYADSHKNKKWQNYGAATSACCVKALLEYWVPGLPNQQQASDYPNASLIAPFATHEMSVGRGDADRNTLGIEDGSVMSFSSMDVLSLTTKILALVAAVVDTLRTCQRYAARLRIADLSTASLHTDCATIRLGLRQIENMMASDKDKTLEERFEGYVLEEYDGVLQACRLPFSILNIHLEHLQINQVKELDRPSLATKLQALWRNQQMDMICRNITGLARTINILSTAFQSDTTIKTSEIMRSSETKEALKNISSDAASLHESVQNELRDDAKSTRDSVFGDEEFGFDDILMNTTVYRNYFSKQMMNSRQRKFVHHNQQDSKVPPLKAEAVDISLANAAENFLVIESGSTSYTSTIHATSAVVKQVPRSQEPSGPSNTPRVRPSTDFAGTTAPILPAIEDHRSEIDSITPISTPDEPRAENVERIKPGSSVGNVNGTGEPNNISPSPYKYSKQPSLINILLRRTPPYSAYDFYIYMRDIQRSVEYLDFCIDVHQHLVLCKRYLRDLGLWDEQINDDFSEFSTLVEEGRVLNRYVIRASAENILYTYLLPGVERKIRLPENLLNQIIHSIEVKQKDDLKVFLDAKDYVYLAMERDAYPGFMNLSRPLLRVFRRSKSLGPLVNKLSGR